MEVEKGRCASCGEPLSDSQAQCPACGQDPGQDIRPSRGVLLGIIVLLVVGFVVTGILVRGHRARQLQLAQRWLGRGDRDLARGVALQAVDEFQTALAYAPENDQFRFKLALALMQAGREDEARVYLVNLWEAAPGDANVNLQLARIMARLGHSEEASRYYHGAIYGVWDTDPVESRQLARLELADYLLSTRQGIAAESELIALGAESPASAEREVRLGDMFLRAGDPTRALSAYLHARGSQPDVVANLGAARAAFALHRFREARDYARDAYRGDSRLEDAAALEQRADAILKADPQATALRTKDRAARAYAAYFAAAARLAGCSGAATDPLLRQLGGAQQAQFRRLSARALRRDPDLLQQAVRWAYDVEKASESVCGAPVGLDATLLTLAQWPGAH